MRYFEADMDFFWDFILTTEMGSELWKSFKINLLSGTDLASIDFYAARPEMDF